MIDDEAARNERHAEKMKKRKAFQDRNIAKSRNEWLYPYDPWHVPLA